MDVTCPRCATEYEFDETLVSDRGTTVKCTNCGHLFKVYPPGARPSEGERAWMVRRHDGTEQRLGSLRELQQRITRGELEVDDEISRSGEAWKRLGDIAELQTFFRAAQATKAPTADATEADPRKQTLFGVGAAPAVPPPPPPPQSQPPRAAPPPPTAPPPTPPRAAPAASAPGPSPRAAVTPPPRPPSADERGRTSARPPTASRSAARPAPSADPTAATIAALPPAPSRPPQANDTAPSARPRKPLYLDDADERAPVRPTKHSRTGLWVLLGLLVVAGGAAAYRFLPAARDDDPVAEFLQRGDEALAQDTLEGYEDALREYLRASAHDERDPRVLAALAETYAAWAQLLEQRASDLEARAANDPALRGEASSLRRERDRRAREAKEQAETLLRLHPGDPRAELAIADALRLNGERAGAREHLDRARAMFDAPPAQWHLVDALLALGREETGEAAEAARAAVSSNERLIRARLLLARIELAQGDVATARSQIEAVLAQAPDHPEARHLADAMDRGLPPAAPVVEVPDAGVDSATPPSTTPPDPTPAASAEPPARTTRERAPRESTAGGTPPQGRDYSWYIRRGDALVDSGDLDGARAHYELAEGQRPGSVEALTGLGQVALRRGNLAEAARRFRPAARADYGDAYIGLAETYRRMGRVDDAIATYRAYLASRPTGPHAGLARRRIEALTPADVPAQEPTSAPSQRAPSQPAPTPAGDPPAVAPAPAAAPPEPTAEPATMTADPQPAPAP